MFSLLTSSAFAQLLTHGNGKLPACGQTCPVLTLAQQACNGASSTSIEAWVCFCKSTWKATGGALTTICATSCTDPQDKTQVETWYTSNCGSDNGASEHGVVVHTTTLVNGTESTVTSFAVVGGATASAHHSTPKQSHTSKPSRHSDSLSTADGVGVGIGVAAAGLLMIAFVVWIIRRHRRKPKPTVDPYLDDKAELSGQAAPKPTPTETYHELHPEDVAEMGGEGRIAELPGESRQELTGNWHGNEVGEGGSGNEAGSSPPAVDSRSGQSSSA